VPETAYERLQRGRERVREEGGRLGGRPPYGYVAAGQNLLQHPDEQPVVWLICHLRRQGWGPTRTAELLEHLGIPCRGSRWTERAVRKVILREVPEEELKRLVPVGHLNAGNQLELGGVT
jgi:hypothetical protein